MLEIVGVKGGLGTTGSGGIFDLGGDGIGFALSEIEMFGIKSKGEKVFIILDASAEMMYDEMGGIPAYTIIKEELIHLLKALSPTTVFNVAVYDNGRTFMLFPSLTSAQPAHVAKAIEWLKPLNTIRPGTGGGRKYGTGTLGLGGNEYTDDLRVGKFETQDLWYRSAMLAMKDQADTVFVLTSWWGSHRMTSAIHKDQTF